MVNLLLFLEEDYHLVVTNSSFFKTASHLMLDYKQFIAVLRKINLVRFCALHYTKPFYDSTINS